jgi:ABC-type nitrate/sulfonate/bicarbonate transport system substrate-binding protein
MIEDMRAYKKTYYEEHKDNLKQLIYTNLKERYKNDEDFRNKIKGKKREEYKLNPVIRERKRQQYLLKKTAKRNSKGTINLIL